MTHSKLLQQYDIVWEEIIEECDFNGDGVIDFQEFMSACCDRKVLRNETDLKVAFKILDTNKWHERHHLFNWDKRVGKIGFTKEQIHTIFEFQACCIC